MFFENWSLYEWLLSISFASALIVFVILLFIDAPYGRFSRRGWGPQVNNNWGWCIMESPAVFVFGYLALRITDPGPILWIFFLMWQIHYVHRSFIYPFTLKSSHGMPLIVVLMAILFNVCNGYLNGTSLQMNAGKYTSSEWHMSWQFQLGVAIFLLGLVINKVSDAELRRIRMRTAQGYRIPSRYLHQYVSCPNYLGEIVQWSGWAIATWSLAGLSFALWTLANLLPRALATHRWYIANFPAYPNRKALIPGIL